MAFTQQQAEALAAELDVSLDSGICHACLSFVSFALERGDERELSRELRRMTRDLWEDGLAESALPAARRAVASGVPGAAEAVADLGSRGGNSVVARALVLRLAGELSERARRRSEALDRVRNSLGPAAELN